MDINKFLYCFYIVYIYHYTIFKVVYVAKVFMLSEILFSKILAM